VGILGGAVSWCLRVLPRTRRSGGHAGPNRALHALLDTWLGVVIVVGAGLVIPGQWGLLHLQPHPLWFVVLAVALRYGAPAGYGAGGLAGVSYGLLVWLQPEARFQPLGQDDLLRAYLLFATGVLVSDAVRGARQRFVRLEEKYQKVAETLQEVTERYRATLDVKAELEKRIIDQPASIATLYTMAKKLTTPQASALYPAILDLVVTFLEAEACALYLQDNRHLRLRAGRPEIWPGRPEVYSAQTDLIGQVLAERRVVTIRDRVLAVGPSLGAREAVLMAGPLLDPNGQVTGVVVVERLPYVRLTPTNVQLFELILDWASTALHMATLCEQSRDRTGEEDDSGAHAATRTMQLLQVEFLRARRYHLPLSVIVVQVGNVPAAELARLMMVCRHHLREVDVIGHLPEPGHLMLILPLTPLDDARVAAQRIGDQLQAHRDQIDNHLPAMRFGIAAFSPDMMGAEQMLAQARTALHPPASSPPSLVS
jgi:hypothetical protein